MVYKPALTRTGGASASVCLWELLVKELQRSKMISIKIKHSAKVNKYRNILHEGSP